MNFDNICKFLAENFSSDFATWLLGEPITLTELSPKELSLEPIRADALILLQSEETESRNQSNIAASTAILAGLVLDKEVTLRVLRSDIMRESVIYQDILEEGKAEALLEKEAGEQGALSWGEGTERGIRPHLNENHLIEVGDSDPCSAPLHGRSQGSFPPAPCPLPPASSLK
ncbi:MAG: hypothetical protein V7K86_30465 [Nostoc sp.]